MTTTLLKGATFDFASIIQTNLSGGDLSNARFNRTSFIDVNLKGCNLTGISISYSQIDQTNTSSASLSPCSFFCDHSFGQKTVEVELIQYKKLNSSRWSQGANTTLTLPGMPYPGTVISHAGRFWLVKHLVFGAPSSKCMAYCREIDNKWPHESIAHKNAYEQSVYSLAA